MLMDHPGDGIFNSVMRKESCKCNDRTLADAVEDLFLHMVDESVHIILLNPPKYMRVSKECWWLIGSEPFAMTVLFVVSFPWATACALDGL